jgi:DNA-binding MarR family transcriptional regulator
MPIAPEPLDTPEPGALTRTTYLIKRVERGIKTLLDEQLRELGVTRNQYTALTVLRARPGISSAELARRSFVTAQAMNQVIAVLEHDGLIRREPDPSHQKILRTFLTPLGQQLLVDCDRHIDEAEAALLSGLTHAQRRAFNSFLTSCIASLNEMRHLRP